MQSAMSWIIWMDVEKVEGEIHDVQYADPEDEEDWEEIDEE